MAQSRAASAAEKATDKAAEKAVETAAKQVNPTVGDHDRVQMLSLRADGTADQLAPEIIGDKDVAVAAATKQFSEQAVSAADVAVRSEVAGPVTLIGQEDGSVEAIPATTDATAAVDELKVAHEDAASAAAAAAEAAVEKLHRG